MTIKEAIEYFKFHRKIFCEDHLKICPKDSIAYQSTLKEKEFYDMAIEALEQQPKTGHWIMPVQDDGMSDPIYYQVRCSKCGFDLDPQTWHMKLHQYGADKYCPKCGFRMIEPQKSEDQE